MSDSSAVVPLETKFTLSQASSDGLIISERPPLQLIVHFEGSKIVASDVSVSPVFSCLFLGPASHKAMEHVIVWCAEFVTGKAIPLPSYIDLSTIQEQSLVESILSIPFGATKSCEQMAIMLSIPVNTVIDFCNTNPLKMFIPSHRVVCPEDPTNTEHTKKTAILIEFEKRQLNLPS